MSNFSYNPPKVLVAMAIPVKDLPKYNLFVSFNFEANYNLPQGSNAFTQGLLLKYENDEIEPVESIQDPRNPNSNTTRVSTHWANYMGNNFSASRALKGGNKTETVENGDGKDKEKEGKSKRSPVQRSQITRKKVYRTLEVKLNL